MTTWDIIMRILAGYAVTLVAFILMMGLAWVAERIVMWWRRGK